MCEFKQGNSLNVQRLRRRSENVSSSLCFSIYFLVSENESHGGAAAPSVWMSLQEWLTSVMYGNRMSWKLWKRQPWAVIVAWKVLTIKYRTALISCHHHKALGFFFLKIQFLCVCITLKHLKLFPSALRVWASTNTLLWLKLKEPWDVC